jgi:hypothetical protein
MYRPRRLWVTGAVETGPGDAFDGDRFLFSLSRVPVRDPTIVAASGTRSSTSRPTPDEERPQETVSSLAGLCRPPTIRYRRRRPASFLWLKEGWVCAMELSPDVVATYLASATAAGVVGNAAYSRVQRLADWMRERLGWSPKTPISNNVPLTQDQLTLLELLYEAALEEWQPTRTSSVKASQIVQAGRDINAPVVNQATHHE